MCPSAGRVGLVAFMPEVAIARPPLNSSRNPSATSITPYYTRIRFSRQVWTTQATVQSGKGLDGHQGIADLADVSHSVILSVAQMLEMPDEQSAGLTRQRQKSLLHERHWSEISSGRSDPLVLPIPLFV